MNYYIKKFLTDNYTPKDVSNIFNVLTEYFTVSIFNNLI